MGVFVGVFFGLASIFSGGVTARGDHLSPNELGCAHRTLPMGTVLRITHLGTGRSVDAKVRDRGPYVRNRIVDLTTKTARAIGLTSRAGVAHVRVVIIKLGSNRWRRVSLKKRAIYSGSRT